MQFIRKLPIPQEIKKAYPVKKEWTEIKMERDKEIANVISGTSNKFILVIGPCSADNTESVLAYIEKLKVIADNVRDKIIIIPRVYTNKPRTSGFGYMGMLHQPDPNGEPDLLKGLIAIRDLHLTILRDYSFTCADELLYPDNYRYLSDLLSYVAIGARSVENQYHRLVASGLEIPVGMKNPISGDLSVMMHSIVAANKSHAFLYRGWEVVTSGNKLTHGVLRGYKNPQGEDQPNYSYGSLLKMNESILNKGLNVGIIVDTNHSNSGKQYEKQIDISMDVLKSRRRNIQISNMVKGLMIESYLYDGSQKITGGVAGKSITDPCLGWDKTERLIYQIADNL